MPHTCRTAILLATCILGLGCQSANLTDAPSPENFLRRTRAAATVLGNHVYIEGGELSHMVNGSMEDVVRGTVQSTLSIALSKSWTSAGVVMRTIPKAKEAPRKRQVGLWTDAASGAFYSWGGAWPGQADVTNPALWKFTADGEGGGNWSLEEPANPAVFRDLHSTVDSAFTNTKSTGFVMGGIVFEETEPRPDSDPEAFQFEPVVGMATLDMETRTWRNATADFGFFETVMKGSAHHLPAFGPSGLILQLAGYAPPPVGSRLPESYGPALDLRNLTFFDLQTKKRHWQMATGSIPPTARGDACTAMFPTVDGGYDIFLFGGSNHPGACNYQDAYILSLPGFVWTKLPDPLGGRRTEAACVRVGKRQVLSIGGWDNGDLMDRDPVPQGLLLFDMMALEWRDTYDAGAAEYERAPSLQEWYKNGSLDQVEWSSDEVRSLFVTARTTTDSTTSPGSGSGRIAAIAGGVVGSVAAVALIGIAAWVLIRRRRRQHQQQGGPEPGQPGPDSTNEPGHETEIKDVRAISEVPAAHGFTEMPARDRKSTYPFAGPVEMDPDGRPVEMYSDKQPAPVELDATPGGIP